MIRLLDVPLEMLGLIVDLQSAESEKGCLSISFICLMHELIVGEVLLIYLFKLPGVLRVREGLVVDQFELP